ncbi:MAG TPA: LD-carboxypeptidase [Terriglobales bacterium]
MEHPQKLKPRALHTGDTVAIVAPASYFNRDEFHNGCVALRSMGYNVVYDDSIFDRDLYFAGRPERRIRELEQMFARDDVKGIVCARGGYGSNYLLQKIDIAKIAASPKIFVGYSDLTSLMTYLYDQVGLVTFHGPMVAKDLARSDGVDVACWRAALEARDSLKLGVNAGLKPLIAGGTEGVLYGGCLSMLAESLGTPYEIHTSGTILFIEDVAAKPYQIDRMLMHLKLAGKFDGVRGLIFGEMLDCIQAPNQGYTLEEVVLRVVSDLNVPVACGLRSGHVSRLNITLPMGVNASLSVDNSTATLEILESATTP